MSTYKDMIRNHLNALAVAGATQREIAEKLGLDSPNFISMMLSDRNPKQSLPLKRLPRFCSLCGLTAVESLRLVKRLVASKGKRTVELDDDTLNWIIRCTALALKEKGPKEKSLKERGHDR